MLSFDYLLTTRPHHIRAVFVSDLHLSQYAPALTQAFLALIQDLSVLPNLQSLYILGDWLDAWVGDDDFLNKNTNKNQTANQNHWLSPVINALATLSCRIYIMHGNRDFMLGQTLCDCFDGVLIDEPFYLYHHGYTYRLEHGDKLCTDDTAYQRYRTVIRNPVVKFGLSRLPFDIRQKLAGNLKAQSTHQKQHKAVTIMDTNPTAVQLALQDCDFLVHGHTHRPNRHVLGNSHKQRFVLGDWQVQENFVKAVIGVLDDDFGLAMFQTKIK